MKTRYLALIMGMFLVGCGTPAAATELAARTDTTAPVPATEMPTPIEAPESTFSLTPFQWTIEPIGSDIWRMFMIVRAEPMTVGQLGEFGGSLVWSETTVELCTNQEGKAWHAGINVRHEGEGFLLTGDGFESNWQAPGCLINDAFASYGVPDYACIFVKDIGGAKVEYCSTFMKLGNEGGTPFAGVQGIKTSGGSLWAWNENEIWRYTRGEWSYYTAAIDNLNDVAYISETLWAAGNGRLQYFDGNKWQVPWELNTDAIEADDESGNLWVMNNSSLYRWDVDEMSYIKCPSVPLNHWYDVAVTGDGSIWAGGIYGYVPTEGGLARYDDATGSWERVRPWHDDEDVPVQVMAATPNGDLWVMLVDWSEDWEALWEAGDPFVEWALAYWDSASGEWTVFEQDLPEGYPMVMAADDEGVWLAQGGGLIELMMEFDGLVHFDGENWSQYLPGTKVEDVAVAPNGMIWYMTWDDDVLRKLR
jgi:hypothetical protein